MSNPLNNHLIQHWFTGKQWKILPFQKEAWDRYEEGKSGLISVPTGAGKTYAAYLPALDRLHKKPGKGVQILYVTPLKALATDLEYALKKPVDDLHLPYRVERRTGDISASHKNKQKKNPPEILLITPESLALLLTEKETATKFNELQTIIVDEWHELLSSKRGTLLELCLARLKKWSPAVQIWGLTATIGNLQEAAQVCVGSDRTPCIITAKMAREVIVESILPDCIEKLPWAGYLGMPMLPHVLKQLSPNHPTLIFTNTRSQAERWYQALLESRPEWENLIALHHSAIDKKSRERIEEEIKAGVLRFVVCTSTLDLGIDLPIVEKVIQIGSPKSVSRLIQRAGRSSHKPLTPCRIAIVPTHALEVIELKGYRMALSQHVVEERIPLKKCYDVLLQHMTTCAIGGGFDKYEFFKEVKTSMAFEELTFPEFENCLQFLLSGGKSLDAYPEYKKLIFQDGLYVVTDAMIVRRHKMSIGTISSDPYVAVQFAKGKTIGMVEESFLTQLKTGDSFLFAGKNLQLVQYRDLIAYVRLAKNTSKQTVVWRGSRLPFSAPLGEIIRKIFDDDKEEGVENQFLQGILYLQNSISHLPQGNELLIEKMKSREGWHLFAYPFEGKTIHEGVAKLMAHRLTKANPSTLTMSCNDYGFELFSHKPFDEKLIREVFSFLEDSHAEIQDLINMHEASKGNFRDIARIAGLIFPGFPRKHKSSRQIHMSTALLFEVLQKYDPDNVLIEQAKREVIERQFEKGRLIDICKRLSSCQLVVKTLQKFSPFSLPLFVERISGHLSSETLLERVQNIQKSWKGNV